MNIQQLEYVITIDRYMSFNKAAQVLFISQPGLSAAIKELEKEIGFHIFTRSSKGSTPTAKGSEFIKDAQKILAQLHEFQNQYNSSHSDSSVLSISPGRYSFVTASLMKFLNSDFNDAKRYSIYVNETNTYQTIEDVHSKKSEVGFIHVKSSESDDWKKALDEKGLSYHFLIQTRSCIILKKDHPLVHIKNLKKKDIFKFPLIQTTGFNSIYNSYDNHCGNLDFNQFKKRIYTNNRTFLYDYLKETEAIFIGITNLAISELHPETTTIPIPGNTDTWDIYYVKMADNPLSINTKQFIDILKDNFCS